MKKALIAIFVFVALCVSAGFWMLKDFDQKLRSEIIAAVSEKTGRSLLIDGETKTRFSLSPSVTIGGIKLANAPWAEQPYMLQIGTLSAQAELLPLFGRRIKIKRFVLDGVRLNLETDRNGRNNWTFPDRKDPADGDGQAGTDTAKTTEEVEKGKKKSFAFEISDLILQNGDAVFIDRRTGETFNASLNALNLRSNENDMTLTSDWTVRGTAFSLTAKADAFTALFDGKEPYAFSAGLDGQGLNVVADGTILRPFKENGIKASVKAVAANLSILNPFAGRSLPAVEKAVFSAQIDGTTDRLSVPSFNVTMGDTASFAAKAEGSAASLKPLVLQVRAEIDAPDMKRVSGLPALPASKMTAQAKIDNGIDLEKLALKIGRSDLTGRVLVKTDRKLSVFGDFHSALFDLSELPKSVSVPSVRARQGSGGKSRSSSSPEVKRVFSNAPLPFDRLKAADINVTAGVDRLIGADGTDLGKIAVTALMRDGRFTLSNFNLANYVSARAVLDASGQTAAVETDVRFNKMPLALFYAKDGVDRGTLTGAVRLSSRGVSQSALAAALNGRIFLNVKDLHVGSFRLIGLPSFLSFLAPADKTQALTVSCAVVNVPVKNGVLTSDKRIGLESNLFDMQAGGNIDFGTEKIDLKIDVSPRSDGILESVFNSVSIGGTLAFPVVRLNAEKTFDRALSLGMAFFAGGKKAVKELVRQEALKNVCADALRADKK